MLVINTALSLSQIPKDQLNHFELSVVGDNGIVI